MIEIAVVIGGLIIIIYLFYKDYKKDRDFNKAIQKCKNGKEIEREVMKFYAKKLKIIKNYKKLLQNLKMN